VGGAEAKTVFDYYATLFPGLSVYASADAGGMRLLATEKGAEALRQVLMPASSPPKFSAWIPAEGWAAARFSVNLKEVFAGVEALLPPTVPAPGQEPARHGPPGGGDGDRGSPGTTLAEGFGGHVVVAGSLASIGGMSEGKAPRVDSRSSAPPPRPTGLLDTLVGKVDDFMGGMGGGEKVPVEKVTLAGVAARKVSVGPLTLGGRAGSTTCCWWPPPPRCSRPPWAATRRARAP
jgi:hypothetical protein